MCGLSGGMDSRMQQPGRTSRLKSRKLLFLIPSLSGGGAERVASLLFPYLSEHFDLTVVLLENRRHYSVPDGIKTVALSGELNGQWAHLVRAPWHIFSFARLVKSSGAGVVLSFMEQANILNILTSFVTGHRPVVSQRTVPRVQYGNKGILGTLIYGACRALYPKSARVITVSSQLRDIVLGDYGLMPERVSFVPNPVNTECLAREAAAAPACRLPLRYVLNVGRFHLAQKGQDVLVKAFASLKDRFPDLSLVLVGEGPDRPRIDELATRLCIRDRVWLVGWQQNVASLMRRAELFVLTSYQEGWPNVLVEAMACGCPVISTDCSTGPGEILEGGRYGALVRCGDEHGLAEVMRLHLEHRASSAVRAKVAEARAQHFDLRRVGKRYVDIINSTL